MRNLVDRMQRAGRALVPIARPKRPARRLLHGSGKLRDITNHHGIESFEHRNPQSSPVDFARSIPDGDDKERDVCQRCGFVAYDNPKVVAGAVLFRKGREWDNPSVLLGERGIPPREGTWGHPAGFLELGEGADAGAAREAKEELCVDVDPAALSLLSLYSIPNFGQVHTYHVGVLSAADASRATAGHETLAAAWVPVNEVDWDALAFPTSVLALADAMAWWRARPESCPTPGAVHRTVTDALGSTAADVLRAHGLEDAMAGGTCPLRAAESR